MIVKIKGRPWSLVFVPKVDDEGTRGDCNNGRYVRRMRIVKGMSSKETMEVVIHEMLHAHRWSATEKQVTDTAAQIADTLARLGYRRA